MATAVIASPFLFTLAGDAQVHLAIAEQFAQGRPFRYNPGGEMVVASTSPFWTLLLILFYALAGASAPLLLKATSVIAWGATAVLLYRTARDHWRLREPVAVGVLALWLAHTTVVANALSGLENGLGALQLLWLYHLALAGPPTRRRVGQMGLLLGWALLTRPDVGLFALALLALYALAHIGFMRQIANWRCVLIGAGAAVLLLLPWYAYQFAYTGRLVTDSSLARLLTGRQGALPLWGDWLYLHPKALLSLAAGFLPLGVGGGWLAGGLVSGLAKGQGVEKGMARATAVLLTLIALLFFTFGVGAEAFGRYFLPIYPFFFLAGVAGWQQMMRWLGRQTAVRLLTAFAILFLIAASGYDYYRRLGPGHLTPTHPLEVLYGPANLQYYAFNLFSLVQAPVQRTAVTDQLLADLQAADLPHITFAVTEVQLRYYVDERVMVLSLDGRTSAQILAYMDASTGVPDFAAYFRAARPDFVHVAQWCAVGGWLAALRPAQMTPNLLCQWQQQVANMPIGAEFSWEGNRVRLVAPDVVRILWQGGDDELSIGNCQSPIDNCPTNKISAVSRSLRPVFTATSISSRWR